MTSIAATHYFSHPWFDKPSMKRRHSSSSPETDDVPLNVSPVSPKRRRVTALERGFSNLSLHHVQPEASTSISFVSPPTSPPNITYPPPYPGPIHTPIPLSSSSSSSLDTLTAMEVEYSSTTPTIQPDSVEEPTSPSLSLPEVRMKGSSWYEPEPDRIVVTDLDSSDEEDEDEVEPVLNPIVSPALLERIRQRELLSTVSMSVPPLPDQQALVLYRPLPRPSTYIEPEDEQSEIPKSEGSVPDASLSLQDVEMMDVE
ncbi:hypothetical protein F5878DRAFT_537348 [Lentinula raphanica]|uniref:Uncharacterized protein n=1 Tax=Lentinula raphanica TaxID=153919 RepID=A0AA38UE84_9AGAR|nr:hypothetical protein F5880DRAFT_1746573 [Lentinula raphanica]KAJ3838527.1 hypothetical protein F5878DRAFT_537348 [Lentinula raphanica]